MIVYICLLCFCLITLLLRNKKWVKYVGFERGGIVYIKFLISIFRSPHV